MRLKIFENEPMKYDSDCNFDGQLKSIIEFEKMTKMIYLLQPKQGNTKMNLTLQFYCLTLIN